MVKRFSKCIEWGVFLMLLAVGTLTACLGGGGSSSTSKSAATGFTQAYTASAGVGEALSFSVDTTQLTYSYTVTKTSYAASGVTAGQTGTGSLTSNGNGSYTVGVSSDSFIQSGKVFPIQNGLLVGHVQINTIGGTNKIPVFGLSNPITTIAALAGTYNYQGFSCSALGIANAYGNAACLSHFGTGTLDTLGSYTICKGGDITTSPTTNACVTTKTGTVQIISTAPGVFDYRNNANGHIGWFFAFTAPNGQKVAVIDHDDGISATHEYGHSVLSTYASTTSGSVDGNYFVKNNEGGEHFVTISGTTYTNLTNGYSGTITYNSPWSGMGTYQVSSGVLAASGIAMVAGTGAYTHINNVDPALFAVGIRY